MIQIIGYSASILMGITLGMMGAGGSILTVPILVYIFQLSPIIATTYSLFIVGSTAFVGGLRYLQRKEVDLQTGMVFAVPSFAGVYIMKAYIIPAIPDPIFSSATISISKSILIMMVFAIIMVAASISMLKSKSNSVRQQKSQVMHFLSISVQGYFVGSVAGFVGAGGGFLIIPALVVLIGMPMKNALGTSLFIIAANSLFGFVGGMKNLPSIEWYFLIQIAILAIIGIFIGMRFSNKVSDKKLKKIFGYFVLVMGCYILFDQIVKLLN